MEAVPLRAGHAQCVSNMQHDMVEQTLAIVASMVQQAPHDATRYYCAEAKRKVIMPRNIELALKRLVLPGSAYYATMGSLPSYNLGNVTQYHARTSCSDRIQNGDDVLRLARLHVYPPITPMLCKSIHISA